MMGTAITQTNTDDTTRTVYKIRPVTVSTVMITTAPNIQLLSHLNLVKGWATAMNMPPRTLSRILHGPPTRHLFRKRKSKIFFWT